MVFLMNLSIQLIVFLVRIKYNLVHGVHLWINHYLLNFIIQIVSLR